MNAEKSITENFISENWRCFAQAAPQARIVEAPLYTDAHIIGESASLGPYKFINTIAMGPFRDSVRPAIMMRIAIHAEGAGVTLPTKNDSDHYHGGDYLDELAALLSLFLGIRVQAGAVEREFETNGDPLGRPVRYHSKPTPFLPSTSGTSQLPKATGQRNLEDLAPIDDLIARDARNTNALVKAARQYQQALWSADADPALAWLLLVSALETAAVARDEKSDTAVARLEAWNPEIHHLIERHAPDILPEIAEKLTRLTGSTRKFVGFMTDFAPPPPPDRPPKAFCISYEKKDLKKAAQQIYGHRSNALHGGVAIPYPMCRAPQYFTFKDVPESGWEEKPTGLASGAYGAVWTQDKTPMLLHTFEYIVRHAILNWWSTV